MEALSPLTADPAQAALFFDVDGTLAPIVHRAQDAAVPKDTSLRLAELSRRYACVACISGRAAADVRRLVGVGGIAYAGSHGAELLEPNARSVYVAPEFKRFEPEVKAFVAGCDTPELRALRVRIEDKGPIMTFHWRGAPDEQAAQEHVKRIAKRAEAAGLWTHWGRKVLEVRPPVEIHKGQAVRALLDRTPVRAALYAGDDVTDLDGYAALEELQAERRLDSIVRVGVRSDEGPDAIVERADLVVDGVAGLRAVLEEL
ncbi:MAG TPA: trehalose-phosphatase [Thermoleophilaceae bacterium]|nr:trehalose-phosphatase [Thermoleophilaceae bacterium]